MRTYWLELKSELLAAMRTPRYSVSTVLFPAMFYIFFGVVMKQQGGAAQSVGVMTAMATMGVMLASLWGLGAGIASERGLGWLEVKRASPMPPMAYFLAKVGSAMVFSAVTVSVIFALAGALGGVRMAAGQWMALGGSLVAGGIPFAALGFCIGYVATPNSAPAMVNLTVLPMSFLSGLWIPMMFLPKAVRSFAEVLPSYHLNQIATAMAGLPSRGALGQHVEGLVAATLVFGGVAWIVWRRDEKANFS